MPITPHPLATALPRARKPPRPKDDNVAQLKRALAILQACARATEAAMSTQDTTLLIVNSASRIMYLSAPAGRILALEDGPRIAGNMLGAAVPAEATALHSLITKTVSRQAYASARPILLTRPSGLPAFEALVIPISGSARAPGLNGAMAAVFLHDPAPRSLAAAESFRQRYGLTGAETRLMQAILTEDNLEAIAGRFHVSKETLRTQLKSIFHKTGTKSQLELLRLGLRGGGEE